MAGYRKRARKDCGRKRSCVQNTAGKRAARVLTPAERRRRRRKRYAEDPQFRESILAANRAWHAANTREIHARRRKRCAEDPKYRRKVNAWVKWARLKHDYGITPEEYRAMVKRQKGRCAICEKKFRRRRERGLDHCHYCHFVRGLLCTLCNLGIGYFKDQPKLLKRAVKYLERAAARARKESKRHCRNCNPHRAGRSAREEGDRPPVPDPPPVRG
jgi:hypothetical protein